MNIIEWLKECHEVLKHPAHKAEQPMHVIYFLLVGYYAGGPYGAAALCCAFVTLVGWGDEPPHA